MLCLHTFTSFPDLQESAATGVPASIVEKINQILNP
jgi:hypothetical protein